MDTLKESVGSEEWIPKQKPGREYKLTVCATVNIAQIESILKGLKDDRAPGLVDGVTFIMLKLAFNQFKFMLTDLANQILNDGEVP